MQGRGWGWERGASSSKGKPTGLALDVLFSKAAFVFWSKRTCLRGWSGIKKQTGRPFSTVGQL